MIWHRTRDNPPDADRRTVLTYHDAFHQHRIANANEVREFPKYFDWWTEITRPPKET